MIYGSYEISLWTHSDKFVTILASSGTPSLGAGYSPRWNSNTNGETKLSFTIPIIYVSPETGLLVNNEKWYTTLKQNQQIANEKKVKLIFDKFETDVNGNYAHTIYEYIIESLVEERTDTELVCQVECVGAPFKELGRTGLEIVLGLEQSLLEDDAVNIVPTINHWLDKIFPAPSVGETKVQWSYAIEMFDNVNSITDKIYETDTVKDWNIIGDKLTPTHSATLIEKMRFIEASDSNRYNITQDLAETFQVFVKYRYLYENDQEPFRATKKQVVFYDRLITPSEYSITYGNNELGLSRTSSSVDVVTKMFVDPIESEYSDDGFVSLEKARNSKTKDNFILDFDYFIKSGQMPVPQQEAIPTFEKNIRMVNEDLAISSDKVLQLEYDILLLEADINNLENKRNSTEEGIADIDEKLEGYNNALASYIVSDDNVFNTAKLIDGDITCVFRRRGVIASSVIVKLPDNTLVGSYEITKDQYGYGLAINFDEASGIVDKTLIRLTYNYDLLSFFRNERATLITMGESIGERLATKTTLLITAEASLETEQDILDNLQDSKRELVTRFNNYMSPFLKEGRWSDSTYQPSFEKRSETELPLVYDPVALPGELTGSYRFGEEVRYFPYILLPEGLDSSKIEQLVVVESFTEVGRPISRELRYGAQWEPQFIYTKVVSDTHYDNITELTSANPANTQAYYIPSLGKVYHKPETTWIEMPVITVLMFTRDVKIATTGHSFSIENVVIPNSSQKTNVPFTVAHRRWFLTEEGTSTGNTLRNIQTVSMKIRRSGLEFDEFDDYVVTHDGKVRSITFAINNKVLYNATEFNSDFKLDISAEQLYRDALDVSKTSAFPEVSYEVSFAYLNKSEVAARTNDYNKDKAIGLGSIVRITDYELQILGLRGLVSGIEINLDRPEETTFTVQNYKTKFEDLFSRIVASTEQMKTNGYLYDRVSGAFGADLTLNSHLLQRSIDQGNLTFTSGMRSGVLFGDHGILAETALPYPTGVTGQTLISGEGITLSHSVDADGRRLWTTAISPMGINADLINVGRLDVGMVNIYSGNQRRFSWKADGMFAYRANDMGATMYDTFVRYSDKGLLFQDNGVRAVELGWEGLYIGSQSGSVELTADGGLEIFNAHQPQRELLIKLGGFGTKDSNGTYRDYGMKFYKSIGGVQTETLVSTNSGDLWLRDSLLIGAAEFGGFVGLTGANRSAIDGDPIRIWAGAENPSFAPFQVTEAGALYATSATISGTITAYEGNVGNWKINNLIDGGALVSQNGQVGLSSESVTFWAGGDRGNAPFYVNDQGYFFATMGEISSHFTVSGNLGSPQFASGALGNGWRIDGSSGYAEFNDVFVRGTIASSVFLYEEVSSVGGQLYVAPTLVFPLSSNPIITTANKYEITIAENFTITDRGGRDWQVDDVVSVNAFVQVGGEVYEIRDMRCKISSISSAGIKLTSLLDKSSILCYDSNSEEITSDLTGGVVSRNAKAIYLGTSLGNELLRKGILLNAGGEYSPYLDVYDDNLVAGNPKVRLGKLDGITDTSFGVLSGYGLYTEDAYLTGMINAKSGSIGDPQSNKWIIGGNTINASLYSGKSTLVENTEGIYLGTDGIALGDKDIIMRPDGTFSLGNGAIVYNGSTLNIRAGNISIGTPEDNQTIDDLIGYRVEIISTSDVLSSDILSTTLTAKIWHGNRDMTDSVSASNINWKRVSNDSVADTTWNLLHRGLKSITIGVLDITYSATYSCELLGVD